MSQTVFLLTAVIKFALGNVLLDILVQLYLEPKDLQAVQNAPKALSLQLPIQLLLAHLVQQVSSVQIYMPLLALTVELIHTLDPLILGELPAPPALQPLQRVKSLNGGLTVAEQT